MKERVIDQGQQRSMQASSGPRSNIDECADAVNRGAAISKRLAVLLAGSCERRLKSAALGME
jgi:hypothetical protein